ncbi:MAG: hypothetical protein KC635_04710 [Myxococcales bacterium]|nr:hypothetical protein [Myxococcales bacterium]MCB9736404.1 hypothetical protein [Deltaproteobacteria bacterium]
MTTPTAGRFQPYILQPGSPSAFACFGTWENVKTCQAIDEVDDPLDGCSQSAECRRYTLEQNPPTTRFRVKPRRDGRFEIQQFREFIREHNTYHMDITPGQIAITYPGKRAVPKSKRFFLHVKHLEEAILDVDGEFELIMSLERMVLRQAGAPVASAVVRRVRVDDDPEARRKRIAEKLRLKASEDARSKDGDDDLDIDIDVEDEDLDIDLDDEEDEDVDDLEDEEEEEDDEEDEDDDDDDSDDEEEDDIDDEDLPEDEEVVALDDEELLVGDDEEEGGEGDEEEETEEHED